jgi:ribonuclease H2 subunit A
LEIEAETIGPAMRWSAPVLSIPDGFENVPLEMGIDETGRGSVLGSMVYCGAFARLGFDWPSSVNDSKQLTAEKRLSILQTLYQLPVGFVVRSISAAEISAVMFSRGSANLNSMSHETAHQLVQTVLDAGFMIDSLYVDTVGDPSWYQKYLQRKFPLINVTVCEKADSKYKAVGAASINAKILRDHEMAHIQFSEPNLSFDTNVGSGYPGDALTASWMQRNFEPVFGFPSVARFSWGPVAELFQKRNAVADFDGVAEAKVPLDSAFFTDRGLRAARFD